MLNSEALNKTYLTDEEIEKFFDDNSKSLRMSRREKKKQEKQLNLASQYRLKEVKPLTRTQKEIFDCAFNSNQNMFLHGYAGTGKSFVSLYLLMKQMEIDSSFKRVKIVRSTVPSRDQGFLPGNANEKAKMYELPYHSIFADLYNRGDAYEYFKKNKKVEFESTSYLRGTTWNDTLVLLDEAQNCSRQELSTVLTRVGENCRIVVSGDFMQSDLDRDHDKKGVLEIFRILKTMKSVEFFEFAKEDIVRSGFVKEFILAEAKYKEKKY